MFSFNNFTIRNGFTLILSRGLRSRPSGIERIKRESAILDVQKEEPNDISYREEKQARDVQYPEVAYIPLKEEDLLKLDKDSISTKDESQTKRPKKKRRHFVIKSGPITEEITAENQYERLAEVITPLCKMQYNNQLKYKQNKMSETLRTMSIRLKDVRAPFQRSSQGLPCPLEFVRPSPDVMAYRNKDEFCVHNGVDGNPKTVGFYVGRPHDPLMTCVPPTYLINTKESHKLVAQKFQDFIRASPHAACHRFDDGGLWRNIVVRSTRSGELMVTVYIHPQDIGEDGIHQIMEDLKNYFFHGPGSECNINSLYLQACRNTRCTREMAPYRHIYGQEFITETCLDLKFQISPDAFFQVNTAGGEVLYETVREIAEVSPITTLLDVCCGTGTISLVMSPHVRRSLGIEVVSGAVTDAWNNAKLNNITNVDFTVGKVEKILPNWLSELSNCTDVVAVVNPARAGLHPDVIRGIRGCSAISKLVYVSCNPEGFAMENFIKLGSTRGIPTKKDKSTPFVPRYAVPVDLFPHTTHTELVLLFERANS